MVCLSKREAVFAELTLNFDEAVELEYPVSFHSPEKVGEERVQLFISSYHGISAERDHTEEILVRRILSSALKESRNGQHIFAAPEVIG